MRPETGLMSPVNVRHERGLAAAVVAHEPGDFAGTEPQVRDGAGEAVLAFVSDGEVMGAEQCRSALIRGRA